MTHTLLRPVAVAVVLAAVASPARAQDVISVRWMSLELARDIAQASVLACREKGYQVAAAVVDRSANLQVAMRDTLAPRFTVGISEEKASAVILSSVSSGEFRKNREDIRLEMNLVDGVTLLEGGLPITAAGSIIGAVGVSGAPGGDIDAECAAEGIAAVQDRLDFAE